MEEGGEGRGGEGRRSLLSRPTFQLVPTPLFSSAIDLSIATPSLYLDFSWEVVTDLHGSDHLPICIHSYTTAPPVSYKWHLEAI